MDGTTTKQAAQVAQGFEESAHRRTVPLDLSSWHGLERSYVIGRNINRAYLEIEADSFDD